VIETLTIVGGGSAYAPGLCNALIEHAAELPLATIRLHDLDEAHLAVVAALVRRLAAFHGGRLRIEATSDLAEAVRGADVVLNSMRPGGFGCRQLDESVPVELDLPGQETVGPGGFFFALRSVPAALAVHDAMAAHAPGALLLNYTNPTNLVTQALWARPGPRVLGLCDQSDEDLGALCAALGRPGARYGFRCVGLNHATWYTDVTLDGGPLPPLPARLEPPDDLDEEHRIRFELSLEMARAHPGFWPNSYLPYYLAPDRFVAHTRAAGTRTQAILAGLEAYYDHFREVTAQAQPRLLRHRGSAGFGDLAVRVIAALASDEPRRLVLNVVAPGAAAAFDDGTVIEAAVLLSRNGLTVPPCPAPPEDALPLLQRLERYQRLGAAAAASGAPDAILDALAANPLVDGAAPARALLDRARVAYGDRLPMLQGGGR
jgi:6-phospho-beta-glucosidase